MAYYRELPINSYVIFGTNGEFEKSENYSFRLLWGFPVATLNRNNSRNTWSIWAIHTSLFSKFKAFLYENNLYYFCSSSLTLSGLGERGGLRGSDDQIHCCHSKPLTLWFPSFVTSSFYLWDIFWPNFSKIDQSGRLLLFFSYRDIWTFWKWKNFCLLENCWNWHGGSILGREERFWARKLIF